MTPTTHTPVDLWSLRQDVVAAEGYAATVGTSTLDDLDRLLHQLDPVRLVAAGVFASFEEAYALRAVVSVNVDALRRVAAARAALEGARQAEGVGA